MNQQPLNEEDNMVTPLPAIAFEYLEPLQRAQLFHCRPDLRCEGLDPKEVKKKVEQITDNMFLKGDVK